MNHVSEKLLAATVVVSLGVISVLSNAAAESYKNKEYSVPTTLTRVSQWKDGFSAEEAAKYRSGYSAIDFAMGNDTTAFTYLNLTEILTTMMVNRSGPIAVLSEDAMPAIGNTTAKTKLGYMSLDEALSDPRSRVQAIMIAHKGKIVFERYPGMNPNDNHVWNSASKTITGLLTHLLVEEGLIDLQKPASYYLSYLKDAPAGKIKVADYLHHRAGLDYEETQANMENPKAAVGRGLAGALTPRGTPAGESVREVISDVVSHRSPATAFEYSTFNTQVLGFIIEQVTRKAWNDVALERIWSKVGMEGDAILGLSSAGEALHGGVFASRLRDMLRFGMIFTPSWNKVSEERIVPENYLDKVYAAGDSSIYLEGFQGNRMAAAFGHDDSPSASAYQWDAIFSDGDLFKAGLNGQGIYVSPNTDTVVVYFATAWRNTLNINTYARVIIKQNFRNL